MGGVTDLKYEFTLIKNIHMYNHLLICTDGEKEYRAICESAPEREPTVIFWPDDLGIPPGEKETLVKDLREWASSQGFRCIIQDGRGR